MESDRPSQAFHVEKSVIKLSLVTFVGFVGTLLMLAGSAVLMYSNLPKSDDLQKIADEHGKALRDLDKDNHAQDKHIVEHKQVLNALKDDTRFIKAHIQFLTQQSLLEAQESTVARRRALSALKRVKEDAAERGEPDALQGIADF
jgi:hypothetical protein